MRFKAEIDIMPLKELLDPQGKAVENNLENINVTGISDVRIGKHIHLVISADSKDIAHQKVDEACKKLLSNVIMETYQFHLEELGE